MPRCQRSCIPVLLACAFILAAVAATATTPADQVNSDGDPHQEFLREFDAVLQLTVGDDAQGSAGDRGRPQSIADAGPSPG